MAEADPSFDDQQTGDDLPGGSRLAVTRKRRLKQLTMISVPLLLLVAGLAYWILLAGKVSTDNAYLKQDKVAVSAEVTGLISEIFVRENQEVKAGQLLFKIDPEPYQLALEQANAELALAQSNVSTLASDPALSGADISAARDDVTFASANFERQKALWDRGFTTKADLDAARHALAQARASLQQAEAEQSEARARLANGPAVPGVNPQIAAAMAKKATAQLNLDRTEVRAPLSGTISQSDRLLKGQQLVMGLPVLTIVGMQGSYVEANFKETDLANMRVGQRAKITIDAYGDLELKGHVASIGAGTGSEFSVLPAQNATGNWVKVTQRVPVRIAIDEKSPRQLIAGLSTHVTVYTSDSGD